MGDDGQHEFRPSRVARLATRLHPRKPLERAHPPTAQLGRQLGSLHRFLWAACIVRAPAREGVWPCGCGGLLGCSVSITHTRSHVGRADMSASTLTKSPAHIAYKILGSARPGVRRRLHRPQATFAPEGNEGNALKAHDKCRWGTLHQYTGLNPTGSPPEYRYLNPGHPRNPAAVFHNVPPRSPSMRTHLHTHPRAHSPQPAAPNRPGQCDLFDVQAAVKNGSYRPAFQAFDPNSPDHPYIQQNAHGRAVSCPIPKAIEGP
jgi:hypothetical protein